MYACGAGDRSGTRPHVANRFLRRARRALRQRLYTLPPTNKYSQPLKRSSSEFRNVWALCITVSAQIWQIVGLVEEGLRVLLELVLIEAIHLLALEHELVIIVVIVRIL